MRRWYRYRKTRIEEVRTEAAIDLRDGLLEARADRIRELEAENARLKNELAKALLVQWLPRFRKAPFTD